MWVTRITPHIICFGLGLQISLRFVALMLLYNGQSSVGVMSLDVLRVVGSFIAYALAFFICWGVAEEYRGTKWMRWAWLALTANAGLSLLRPFSQQLALLAQSVDLYDTDSYRTLFLHLVLVPANFCLLLGLLAIWWAYYETGLGFKLKLRDGVAIGGLIVLMLLFYLFRDLLTEAQSVYPLTRHLQLIAQLQMFLIAAASLLLHRVSIQMGGGKLSLVFRWLTIYALLRLGLVLAASLAHAFFPRHGQMIRDLIAFGWQAAPWVFALSVAYRAELTALAAERLAHIRKNASVLAT